MASEYQQVRESTTAELLARRDVINERKSSLSMHESNLIECELECRYSDRDDYRIEHEENSDATD